MKSALKPWQYSRIDASIKLAADFGNKGGNGLSEIVEKVSDGKAGVCRLFPQSFFHGLLIKGPEYFQKCRWTNRSHRIFFHSDSWKVLEV